MGAQTIIEPIAPHINTNVDEDEVVLKSGLSKKSFFLICLIVYVITLLVCWYVGLFNDQPALGIFVITIITLVSFAISAMQIYPLNHKKNTYLNNFCKANSGYACDNWTPLETPQIGIASSVIWSAVADLGRTSETADLDKQYFVAQNGVRGTGMRGEKFYVGQLKRVGPYTDHTFIVIDLPITMPNVLVDADSTLTPISETDFAYRIKAAERYDLEGEFAKYFTLYGAEPSAVRIATYIFTPDIMEKVLAITQKADIEFHGRQLYIVWKPSGRTSRATYTEAFAMLNSVGSLLIRKTAEYLHPEEIIGTPLLKNEIERNSYGTIIHAVGRLGGADLRKTASVAFGRRQMIRLAVSIGFILLSILLIAVYIIWSVSQYY